jgi:EAL domain-containing protein (putative c-di-GMP-specific phosphodiesterase class I)/GGDEF domain-containing protein
MSSAPSPAAEHSLSSAHAVTAPALKLTEYLRRAVADLGASAVGVAPASGGPPRYFTRTVSAAQLLEDICANGSETLRAQALTKSGVFGANRVRAESSGPVRGRLIAVPLKNEKGLPPDILLAVRLIKEPKFGPRDSQKLLALARELDVLLRAEHAPPAIPKNNGPATEPPSVAPATRNCASTATATAPATAVPTLQPAVGVDPALAAPHPDLEATVAALLGWPEFEKHVRAREDNDRLPGCMLYGNMDQLQELNKLAGFAVGDRAIAEVDRALQKATLPPGSCSCHLAGDRYTVYVPSTTLAQGRRIAEQLSKSVGELSVLAHGVPTPLSISFGVALISARVGGLSHALAAAEAACKAAKDRGPGHAEVYQESDPSVVNDDADDMLVADQLREALTAGRIEVFAQPIVRLNGVHSAAHYELLVRVVGDGGTYLAPSWFMSAATRYRLLVDLDRAVVRHVLKKLDAERSLITRRNLRFSVNLFGPSISDADFLEWVVSGIAEAGIPGEWMQFEITETAAVANIAQTQAMITRLQERGVQFALDHFGTSVNSLAYLKHFDVKMLKLDGSYVRELSSNPRSEALVRGIAQLGRSMKIETVAECVESADVRNRLTELGVDWAQGFLFGRPQPLDKMLAADLDRPVEVWGRRSGR